MLRQTSFIGEPSFQTNGFPFHQFNLYLKTVLLLLIKEKKSFITTFKNRHAVGTVMRVFT